MNNLKYIKTAIIDRGIFIGAPAIKFLFDSFFDGDTEICLNSGVREYLNEINYVNICDLFENYRDDFFCFENFLAGSDLVFEILKYLKKKDNYICLSDYVSSDFLNYSDEISLYADFIEIKTALDYNFDLTVSLADRLKQCDLCVSFDIFADSSVEDFDLASEKLSSVDENIKMVLNPLGKFLSKKYADTVGFAYDYQNRNNDTENKDSVLVYPEKEKLLALCLCGNCYLETKVIKTMVL